MKDEITDGPEVSTSDYQAKLSWYRQLAESLPVLISYLDRDMRYQYNNPAYCKWFGVKDVAVLRGRTLEEVLGPAAVEVIRPYAAAALAGERVEFESEIPYQNGGTRTVSAIYSPHQEGGETVGFFALVTDISERKQLEASLMRAEKLEALGYLAGGIAHDFNNLMTGIMGNLELAEMELADGDREAALERLRRCRSGSKMAQELTGQLLTFSKGGAPVKKLANLATVLRETAELAVSGARVRLECSIPDDLWAVEFDAGQMGQVVSNLVINALQAMPDVGVVRLSARNLEGVSAGVPFGHPRVQVEVVDQGCGVPAALRERVFEPYFTTKKSGRGLGLSTAYKIVAAHGGNMELIPGEGSTFRFWLPAHRDLSAREPLTEPSSQISAKRILIMDDDTGVCDVLIRLLERAGHHAVATYEGQRAVQVYRQEQQTGTSFDLVILDLTVVGGQGGKETARQLLEIDSAARIMVSSGYSHDPVMADYRAHGFCDVLPKPYDSAQLAAALARVFSRGQR